MVVAVMSGAGCSGMSCMLSVNVVHIEVVGGQAGLAWLEGTRLAIHA